jgi:hypothetical protein
MLMRLGPWSRRADELEYEDYLEERAVQVARAKAWFEARKDELDPEDLALCSRMAQWLDTDGFTDAGLDGLVVFIRANASKLNAKDRIPPP